MGERETIKHTSRDLPFYFYLFCVFVFVPIPFIFVPKNSTTAPATGSLARIVTNQTAGQAIENI